MSTWMFTSESVTEGHPDKMADQISDAILDALLDVDPGSRVACETLLTTGLAVVAGEMRTEAYVEIPSIVRRTICAAGYDNATFGFDGEACGVVVTIGDQSPDIAMGVDRTDEDPDEQGAGDQGMMFGYACDETDVLMPLPIHLANRLAWRHAEVRRAGTIPYLGPDAKTQVTLEYEGSRPVRLRTVLVSTQHRTGIDRDRMILPDVTEQIIEPVVAEQCPQFADDDYEVIVNPTGKFETGGPMGDTGLTGRKIIVDTYGGMARHGGGAFSGKDPSKVDRSAAYAARWAAKHIVASGAASRCELQVAYAIGMAEPLSLMVETFDTETVDRDRIVEAVREVFDLRPAAIVRDLDLLKPIYTPTAAYGHFGRIPEGGQFTWESTNRLDDLKSALGL
ncbi:MAG: methionine adenosyltransferase [Acidimicrobiaceae bacterium]|nr:methionine adenosyltransferase [Acidimicrobiaceae bacterium]